MGTIKDLLIELLPPGTLFAILYVILKDLREHKEVRKALALVVLGFLLGILTDIFYHSKIVYPSLKILLSGRSIALIFFILLPLSLLVYFMSMSYEDKRRGDFGGIATIVSIISLFVAMILGFTIATPESNYTPQELEQLVVFSDKIKDYRMAKDFLDMLNTDSTIDSKVKAWVLSFKNKIRKEEADTLPVVP